MYIKKPLTGNLGRDADHPEANSDLAFFDWIAGTEDHSTLAVFFMWLIDEYKKETRPEPIRALLQKWKSENDDQEFRDRLMVLEKLMPPAHPFHQVKKEFK